MGETRARRAWVTARRAAVAVATAVVVVLVGSRVNRPVPLGWARAERPRVADEVLGEVRLDERSLATVVDSINAAAERRRVRLELETLPAETRQEMLDASEGGPLPVRLRNVRLGWVLGEWAEPWFFAFPIEWREEAGEIVIGGSGTRPPAAGLQVYDVRDLLESAESLSTRLREALPRSGGPSGVAPSAEFARMINDSIFPYSWQPNAVPHVSGWGGWLLLRGDEAGQRKLEQFLVLLRRGDSGPVVPAGGAQ